ncbi:MAG: hypothetical protein JWO59_930 [Chloroflexi bacterium]|nr:hypothetical protein [Chloroflexota bacterium]
MPRTRDTAMGQPAPTTDVPAFPIGYDDRTTIHHRTCQA